MALAHSQNRFGQCHDLVKHLTDVANLASQFAAKFDASSLSYCVGLWHDAGKFHPAFQAYLNNPDNIRGPDHKGAGAVIAVKQAESLAFLIAGHHGGLQDRDSLKSWLREKEGLPATAEALALARVEFPALESTEATSFPPWINSRIETEFFLRMLFSSLTDADFLDTERHFEPARFAERSTNTSIAGLWALFEARQALLTNKRRDRVNQVRHQVYQACLAAAHLAPGFFRLTVPTGGGKTRSSLAFALRHALRHGMERVIVAIPFTSIIEQTASVFREVLDEGAVIEHHSLTAPIDPNSPTPDEVRHRLASENWDAPVITTTTVQLFESLFSNMPGRCRKLHNIAKAVLILDEVQTLPTHLLRPILEVLRELVSHYGVSVVFCTATQPALQESSYLKGIPDIREIAPDPAHLFAEFKRVRYEWAKGGDKTTWRDIANIMRREKQALAVVNTKPDALALLDALNDNETLHLSTLMCGAHRRDTLSEIKTRLREGAPCRLVSTQVVEAGVDLDFPMVLRALGPLDRIVQAAGRCNREGKMADLGRVVLFNPVSGKLPTGPYRSGTALAAQMLTPSFNFDDPHAYENYFRLLYQSVDLDTKHIQELRSEFCFAEVARRFRMIEEDTLPVIVRPLGENHKENVNKLVDELNRQPTASRWLYRSLQPYIVNVRGRRMPAYERQGMARRLTPCVWEWLGRYDPVRGLDDGNFQPEELIV